MVFFGPEVFLYANKTIYVYVYIYIYIHVYIYIYTQTIIRIFLLRKSRTARTADGGTNINIYLRNIARSQHDRFLRDGQMKRWRGGEMEMWRGVEVGRWTCGEMER